VSNRRASDKKTEYKSILYSIYLLLELIGIDVEPSLTRKVEDIISEYENINYEDIVNRVLSVRYAPLHPSISNLHEFGNIKKGQVK